MGAVDAGLLNENGDEELASLLAVLRHAPQGSAISDAKGMVLDCNAAWNGTLGRDPADGAGKAVACLLQTCDQDFEVAHAIEKLPPGAACLEFDARPSAPGDAESTLHVTVSRCAVGARPMFLWQISIYTCPEYFKTRAMQLEQVLEQSGDSVVVKDLNAVVTYWNREATNIYGFSTEDAIGRPLRELQAADMSEAQYDALLARIRAGKPTSCTAERRRKNGEPVWVALKTTPLTDLQGRLIGEITVARDITAIHLAQEALKNAHANMEARVEAIREANRNLSKEVGSRRKTEGALRDANGTLESTVQRLESFHRDGEALSRMAEVLQPCVQRDEAYAVIREAGEELFAGVRGALYIFRESHDALEQVASWGPESEPEGVLVPDDCWALRLGRPHHVRVEGLIRCRHVAADRPYYACLPVQGQGQVLGMLHLEVNMSREIPREARDALERRMRAVVDRIGPALANLKLRDSLRSMSLRDALTGLYNRRYMDDALQREIHRVGRSGKPVSLIMIDIDHFKRFNDTYGHDAGYYVLAAVAQVLPKNLHSSDLACRYGGEELTVVLPEASLACAIERAGILREAIRALSLRHREQTLPVLTASFGVASFPGHGANATELMKAADQALYRAKHLGRDQVCAAEDPPLSEMHSPPAHAERHIREV
ncbi:MAG: diguanylate cyclase [Betaproteobacteria bacterium]|nr:diguanylate cyclase [Betaproteobacteria bacterium]